MTLSSAITTLIEDQDNYELVRDRIAVILKVESEAQQALALAALPDAKDPNNWKLRVFTEATDPWEQFLPVDAPDVSSPAFAAPIVNVWFDQETFDKSRSTPLRQLAQGTFNIDCYGYGVSRANGSGHDPGSKAAALEAQRAGRLVRKMLMAGQYCPSLGFPRGAAQFIWDRFVTSVTSLQPQMGEHHGFHVQAVRIALSVDYSEFAPEYQPVLLEEVGISLKRDDTTGEVFLTYQVGESPPP
jgi:hypothetical protein